MIKNVKALHIKSHRNLIHLRLPNIPSWADNWTRWTRLNNGIKCMDCRLRSCSMGRCIGCIRCIAVAPLEPPAASAARPTEEASNESSPAPKYPPGRAKWGPPCSNRCNRCNRHQVTCSAKAATKLVFSLSFLPAVLIVYFGKPQGL